jgi:hypothetical protein
MIWGNWVSAAAVMLFPLLLIYFLIEKSMIKALIYVFLLFLSLSYTFKGATFGGFYSIVIIILPISIFLMYALIKYANINEYFFKLLFKFSLILIPAVVIFTDDIELSLALEGKLLELSTYGFSTPNLEYRIDLIRDAFSNLPSAPFGIGFGQLWLKYFIDEANFYSPMMNGTGILGTLGFCSAVIIFLNHFFFTIFNERNRQIVFYSIVGLTTILVVLLAAFSSDQVLLMPQTALPFWVLICALYSITKGYNIDEFSMKNLSRKIFDEKKYSNIPS